MNDYTIMNNLKLASGDSKNTTVINTSTDEEKIEREIRDVDSSSEGRNEAQISQRNQENIPIDRQRDEITSEMIQSHEIKLKERVAQCKDIIASLKLELHEEKSKLEKQASASQRFASGTSQRSYKFRQHEPSSLDFLTDSSNTTNAFGTGAENNLICDENLLEYEKQLQRYQNTLNMAQIEKKNVIRKQMLAKAYKLKLLEVENQCNIELLRVKQSLQCLEPLQTIVNKWKDISEDAINDASNYELIPRYPEYSGNSASDINSLTDEPHYIEPVTKN